MGVALLSLKWMIALSAAGLVAGVILVIAGDSVSTVRGTMIAVFFQIVGLGLVFRYLQKGSQIATWLFGLWCVFLLIAGITSSASLIAVIPYAQAVLGFVGLAGLWAARRGKVADLA